MTWESAAVIAPLFVAIIGIAYRLGVHAERLKELRERHLELDKFVHSGWHARIDAFSKAQLDAFNTGMEIGRKSRA